MMREGKEEKGQSGGKQRVTQIKGKDNILAVAKRRNPNEGPADAGAVEKAWRQRHQHSTSHETRVSP